MTDSVETRERFCTALRAALEPWCLSVTNEYVELFYAHYELMLETNRTTNLTRITDPVEAAVKHYADSLAAGAWARKVGLGDGTWLDVGTGAGFPAVPLAVMHPTWQIVAIDGTGKKVDFVTRVAVELGLTNLELIHAHADHWETNRRFDVICTRAVASVTKCLPFSSRLCNSGGRLVAFTTPVSDDREREAADAVAVGCKMIREPSFDYELVASDEPLDRRLVVYRHATLR